VSTSVARQTETLRQQAADLARSLSTQARGSATTAQARAVLRMVGVDGLDRAGRPLAGSTLERFCGSDPSRLAEGVLLPLALAAASREQTPRDVALEVAAGTIDLVAVAGSADESLRAAGQVRASELLSAAVAHFDANRTAARIQREILGSPRQPWLGLALESSDTSAAAGEIRRLGAQGVDVVQITVPASWEFAEARRATGLDEGTDEAGGSTRGARLGRRHAGRGARRRLPLPQLPRLERQAMPAGSQRGLAELRRVADQAAAERGSYVSLMTVTSAFAAPEQAVVAAFERIDFIEADPMREIVEHNVDPDRAIADHAFAHLLQARAGCGVVVGAGPLTLGTELARGVPSDPATRAGRALALQALGAELALACGLPAEQLLLGAVPGWMTDVSGALPCLVQTWLRRAAFPGHSLVVEMPRPASARGGASASWAAPLVASLSGAPAALVIVAPGSRATESGAADLAAAAAAATTLRTTLGDGALHGDAQELAAQTARAARRTLERLAAEGWASLLGSAGADPSSGRLGRSAVVARRDGPLSEGQLVSDLLLAR
jgi:hypothetical protein